MAVLVVLVMGCGNGGSGGGAEDARDRAETAADAPGEVDVVGEVDMFAPEELATPVKDADAATRAFRLYYRERVERAVVSWNRFMLFGDVTFGTNIGKAGIARTGDDWEIVVGPNDNNQIGISIWTTWHAYKVFRTRKLALSLARMFEGLVFFEAVTGHPGVTSRMVYPGWTLVIDGAAGTIERTRGGEPVISPVAPDPALEAEILATFFDGFKVKYREEPDDILLQYMPTQEVGPYSVTYSFSMLPDYLRVSDCCTSLKRTPAPYLWEGAFWGNHNSRDNFPDLSLGYLAALEAMDDPKLDEDVRSVAGRAWEAGLRIGDLVQAHKGRLMTVDEHHPYDVLVVAGAVRPDGETEAEDLGSLSDCQMTFLARALSSQGLDMPLPELPAPGSLEKLLSDFLGGDGQCPVPEPVRTCTRLQEAYCGKDWGNIEEMEFLGMPWLEMVRQLEEETPGSAEQLIGSFQDDFYEKNLALLGVINYARTTGKTELLSAAQAALMETTRLMRTFADLMYSKTKPAQKAEKYYHAALFEAWVGLEASLPELSAFANAESHIAWLEQMLDMPETVSAPLMTDDEILAKVQDRLAGASETAKKRYSQAYGDVPPVRRAGEGYEARGHHPEHEWPWAAVERPHHKQFGGVKLLEALPLCETAPELLDCTWARMGCERPDLDANGTVDEADKAALDSRSTMFQGEACGSANDWCDGADLDRTGSVDSVDAAFMDAALGCRR